MTEEVKRYSVIAALLDGRMTNGEAAGALDVSVRQVKRIKGKVKREGPSGVAHGNSGRSSSRAFPQEFKERTITLAREKYFDFNFSHLSEMLEEKEGIKISRETLRQWLRPKASAARSESSADIGREENDRRRKVICSFWTDLPTSGSGMKRRRFSCLRTTRPESLSMVSFKKKRT